MPTPIGAPSKNLIGALLILVASLLVTGLTPFGFYFLIQAVSVVCLYEFYRFHRVDRPWAPLGGGALVAAAYAPSLSFHLRLAVFSVLVVLYLSAGIFQSA